MTRAHALLSTFAAILLSFYLVASGIFPKNTNFRFSSGSQDRAVEYLEATWKGLPTDHLSFNTADDPGPALLEAGIRYFLEGSRTSAETNLWARQIYLWTLIGLHVLFLSLGAWGLSRWFSAKFAVWFFPLMILTPTMSSLAFSGDVYLFPFYSALTVLWVSSYLKEKDRKWPLLCGGMLLALCDLFRGGTTVLLLYPVLILLFPQWAHGADSENKNLIRRNVAVFLLPALGFLFIQRQLQKDYFHPVWHSIHCGLFEFGGYVDNKNLKVYPDFLKEIPDQLALERRDGWSDEIQAVFLWGHLQDYRFYGKYKPEWDQLFKQEVFRWAEENPLEISGHFLKRIWRWTVMNPWQGTLENTRIDFSEPQDTLIRMLLGGLVILAFALHLPLSWWILLASFVPLAAPSWLVHSGYVMYSYAGHFPWYLLAGSTLFVVFQKFKLKGQR